MRTHHRTSQHHTGAAAAPSKDAAFADAGTVAPSPAYSSSGSTYDSGMGPGVIVLLILLAIFYFIPTLVAASRRAQHDAGIAVLNLFLGWTLVGWVGALVWAVSDPPKTKAASDDSSSRLDGPGITARFAGVALSDVPPLDPFPMRDADVTIERTAGLTRVMGASSKRTIGIIAGERGEEIGGLAATHYYAAKVTGGSKKRRELVIAVAFRGPRASS